MQFKTSVALLSATLCIVAACVVSTPLAINLKPTVWGDSELRKYNDLTHKTFKGSAATPLAKGNNGAVIATYSAPSIRASLEALKQGGTAADTVAMVALTQVALSGGFGVSYSGLFNMLYFDAASGKVFDLNASYNVPQNETDPASIPGKVDLSNLKLNTPANGRSTLIPGFLKGIDAANRRFDKLPFENLFAPAIFLR